MRFVPGYILLPSKLCEERLPLGTVVEASSAAANRDDNSTTDTNAQNEIMDRFIVTPILQVSPKGERGGFRAGSSKGILGIIA